MSDPVTIATVVSAIASTAASIGSMTRKSPSIGSIPETPTFDEAADQAKEQRLRKGRQFTIKNKQGAGGLTQQANLGKPSLTSEQDETKMLLGA